METYESFRAFDAIHEQDPRSEIAGRLMQPYSTLDRWHAYIDTIRLDASVSESVQRNFDRAKNLSLYAWFVFDFHQVAELDAISSFEMALKETMEQHNVEPASGLKQLIRQACAKGWLPDGDKDRAEALADWRNHLAHGTTALHERSTRTLEVCAEHINQLARSANAHANE